MIRVELGVEDLADTRFAISPLAEAVFSELVGDVAEAVQPAAGVDSPIATGADDDGVRAGAA